MRHTSVLALVALLALLPAHAVAARDAPKATVHGRSLVVMNHTKPSDGVDELWATNSTEQFSPTMNGTDEYYPYPIMNGTDEYYPYPIMNGTDEYYPYPIIDDEYWVPPTSYGPWSDVSNVTLVVHFPETELAAFDDDAFRAQFEAMYKRALASGLDVPMANITILNITRGPAAGGSWNMTEESATEREYEYVNATGEYVEDATGEPVYARGRRLMNHDSDYSPNATYAGVRVHSVIEVESNQADEVVSQLGSFYSGRGDFFEIFEPMASAYGRALLRRTTSDNYYYYPTTPSDAEIGYTPSSNANITVTVLFPTLDFSNASAATEQLSAAVVRSVSAAMSVPAANVTVLNITRGPREGEWMIEPRTAVGSTEPMPERRSLLSHGADSDFDPTVDYQGTRVRFTVSLASSDQAVGWAERIGSMSDLQWLFENMVEEYGRALLRRVVSRYYNSLPTPEYEYDDWSGNGGQWEGPGAPRNFTVIFAFEDEYNNMTQAGFNRTFATALRDALTPVIDRNRTAACRLGNFVFERRGAAGEVLITTNVTCRNSVLARRAYALIANETAPPSWERLQERFGEIYPTRMFTWSTALSPGDYRPTRPGQYPDDDSDDESDSEREREWDLGGPELNPQQRVVNMTFELYLDNVAMGRMRNPAFFARVNRSLYSLIATADERATPHVLTCNLTRFKRPAREGNATGVLAEVNCSIASMRAVVMLEELMEESGWSDDWEFGAVSVFSYSRGGRKRYLDRDSDDEDDSDSDDESDGCGRGGGGRGRGDGGRCGGRARSDDSDSEHDSDSDDHKADDDDMNDCGRGRGSGGRGRGDGGRCGGRDDDSDSDSEHDSDSDDHKADDDDMSSVPSPADDDDDDERTESPEDSTMGPPTISPPVTTTPMQNLTGGESGASPTLSSTDQPTVVAPTSTTPLPTTPPPTMQPTTMQPTQPPTTPPPTMQPTQAPTASPTVTPVLANITASASFDTLDITALEDETYKETFETDLKSTMADNLPGVDAENIDIIGYRQGSVLVDFVIQVTSEEQMDDMVNAVKSPEVVASMLTPMVDKGYGEASLMAETLRVVILLSPPPPPELGTDTMAPPALNSAPPFNTAYADNAAAPLSNAVSALLLAALVMMALL